MTTEIFTIGPPTQNLEGGIEPLGLQTFHEVLMKFLRWKEALFARPSRAPPSTGANAGASNERGAAESSCQEVYRKRARIH
jgi:hypothetical protein